MDKWKWPCVNQLELTYLGLEFNLWSSDSIRTEWTVFWYSTTSHKYTTQEIWCSPLEVLCREEVSSWHPPDAPLHHHIPPSPHQACRHSWSLLTWLPVAFHSPPECWMLQDQGNLDKTWFLDSPKQTPMATYTGYLLSKWINHRWPLYSQIQLR